MKRFIESHAKETNDRIIRAEYRNFGGTTELRRVIFSSGRVERLHHRHEPIGEDLKSAIAEFIINHDYSCIRIHKIYDVVNGFDVIDNA